MPLTRAGFMETMLPGASSASYAHQRYYPTNRNYAFARGVNGTGDGWQSWRQETRNTPMQTFTQDIGSVPANSIVNVDLLISGGIDSIFMHFLTVETALPDGIMWCGFKKSSTVYTARFHNITGAEIAVGTQTMRFITLETVAF